MIRKIIHIDEARCTGCGACAAACHEGAIAMVDGRARLLREDHCDGLGDCLPACPAGAITFEEREAPAYDAAAVARSKAAETLPRPRQWPVQLQLAPVQAPWLAERDLLIAADCTAYACPAFHRDFLGDRALLIACPKLDRVDYSVKLTEIFSRNAIRSVTVVRMEVPCCGGLVHAVRTALSRSAQDIPLSVQTLSTEGRPLP